MGALDGFVSLLRELGLLGPTVDPAFEPGDLDAMQAIYDQACRLRRTIDPEERNAIARAVVDAYRGGAREHADLLAAAMTARAQ
jgi:hypothetical protein